MTEQEKISHKFVELGSEKPLDGISFEDLSMHCQIPVEAIKKHFRTTMDIVDGFVQPMNKSVLDDFDVDPDETVKEHLFDILMSYFDALQENRSFFLNLETYLASRPSLLLQRKSKIDQLFRDILIKCHVKINGLSGRFRLKAIETIFLASYREWKLDQSDDLSRTMAKLDKYLSMAEAMEQRRQSMRPKLCRVSNGR